MVDAYSCLSLVALFTRRVLLFRARHLFVAAARGKLGDDAPKEADRTKGWLPERPITPLKEPGKADKP
jgi:hypothetical protein